LPDKLERSGAAGFALGMTFVKPSRSIALALRGGRILRARAQYIAGRIGWPLRLQFERLA
jgi:hypothetical protein